ncbi:MAG TPA: acyclic terpene utilization AtuA family protein [Gemmatimonadaceae bacterium]|nr:acyclic terpene utilization AtuA family protein [Gemmatimonadaceae bacterium]
MTAARSPSGQRIVRVASGQGFWGDWLEAPRRQVEGGDVDYLMLDYLAEVTMSILQKQKERDPNMGYARDFIGAIESVLPAVAKRGVRVVANAGGVNPPACAAAVRQVAKKHDVSDAVRIGVVTGDDLLPRLDELIESGHPLANMETDEPLSEVRDRVLSANAYLGSVPIVEALANGANVVITGRSTDTALTMAPLRHEFGWKDGDWDHLAAGIVAGHIIECGAQCSGGNCLVDWQSIPDLANIGYPIVEGSADGTFVIAKHPKTGGRITVASISEQLVYEMGDPHSYITPDVIADFTTIRLEQIGENRVRVYGIKGRPATDKLKVSIAYRAGFKAVGSLVYSWPDALPKAQLADRVLRERLDRLGLRFDKILTEFVGASATHGPLAGNPGDPPEVQLRVGVRGEDRAAVERFTREIAPLVLNGPPSVTGFAGGRPKVEEIVAYWPALIDKRVVQPKVEVLA